jgi:hypothetical protein
MTQGSKRSIFRWIHLIFSIPIFGYIYSPLTKSRIMPQQSGSCFSRPSFFRDYGCGKGMWSEEYFQKGRRKES